MRGLAAASPSLALSTWLPIFAAFALTYFLSALLRAVTATLAPEFSRDFGLDAAELGLLGGAYFLGFSLMQLPLGAALDRWGPRRVEVLLVSIAAMGCLCFAWATHFPALVASRALIGLGVSAGLMAPLTCFRVRFPPDLQLRCNSWMLMVGSTGMVAATVPVQASLPLVGWRGIFTALAAALLAGAALLWWLVPDRNGSSPPTERAESGYRQILSHPEFRRIAPLAFFLYGGMIAVQTLWAGPWLTRVSGWTPAEASRGLLLVNLGMLLAFASWGALMPWLVRRGLRVQRLLAYGLPVNLSVLAWIVVSGREAVGWHWMLWCVSASQIALSQPALAQAFPPQLAGRALSAHNLMVFSGVFVVQWGLGLLVDSMLSRGLSEVASFQFAVGSLLVACAASYVWFVACGPRVESSDNEHNPERP